MTWNEYIFFAMPAAALWLIGAWAGWKQKPLWAYVSTVIGILVFSAFILLMWISLERPPLRTMGETRLWYSFFIAIVGLLVYARWHYRWMLSFSSLMALIFICVNLLKPEIHNKTLMPVLQSPWFSPHVIVYMFCYALFGAATVVAIYLMIKKHLSSLQRQKTMYTCDNLISVGLSFMTIGMLMGALWAKEAWGHYWAWDPKETWAAITWFAYLVYLHFRRLRPAHLKPALWIAIIAFLLLQICWWGINFLPSAHTSVHTYNMS